jgi:probable HAF family extracellular repeat protein
LSDASTASGVNDAGQVVGSTPTTAGGNAHAFITGPNGVGMRDLGSLDPTGFWNHSTASGINDAGQVVGLANTAEGTAHAFITGPNGVGMRDLGTLDATGVNNSGANALNDAGQVVGWSHTTAGGFAHAFITGRNGDGIMDLNSLVDMPDGVVLIAATGINDAGQVIAEGYASIIPEPEVYALFLAGLALVGFIARRKKISAAGFSPG